MLVICSRKYNPGFPEKIIALKPVLLLDNTYFEVVDILPED